MIKIICILFVIFSNQFIGSILATNIHLIVEKTCNPQFAHNAEQCGIEHHRLYTIREGENKKDRRQIQMVWKVDENRAVLRHNQELFLFEKNAIEKCVVQNGHDNIHNLEKIDENEGQERAGSMEILNDGEEKSSNFEDERSNNQQIAKFEKPKGRKREKMWGWLIDSFLLCTTGNNWRPKKQQPLPMLPAENEANKNAEIASSNSNRWQRVGRGNSMPEMMGKFDAKKEEAKMQQENEFSFPPIPTSSFSESARYRKSQAEIRANFQSRQIISFNGYLATQVEGIQLIKNKPHKAIGEDEEMEEEIQMAGSSSPPLIECNGNEGWLRIGRTEIRTEKPNPHKGDLNGQKKCVANLIDADNKIKGPVFRLKDELYFNLAFAERKIDLMQKIKIDTVGLEKCLEKVCQEDLLKIEKVDSVETIFM